jgi:transcriptional regulator with PAS, ATPase and Fis domain
MSTGDNNSTSTLRERAAIRRGLAAAPVLLVGSYLSKAGRVVSLDRPVTIGRGRKSAGSGRMTVAAVRGQDAEVILHSDGTLSRAHLRIVGASGACRVEDLDSTNGTFVDGRRVTKPVALSDGSIVLFGNHAGVFRRLSDDELAAIEEEAAAPLGPVATVSPALALTVAGLRRLAAVDADLLFVGETGVGKEIYARAVHAASGRRGEFVAINCASLPSELVESELFGYARGAHSTATRAKQGLVERADGGTLLLDEIGDMSSRLQVKLFRFLQDRQVLPLGSTTRPRRVDVRIMAATSQVSESVRSDLVGRLGAEPILIPPLRERVEDIGALVAHFGGAGFRGMEPAAFRALCLYDWPRNVRQLGAVVKRAVTVAGARAIRVEDLPHGVRATLARGPRVGAARRHRAAPDREVIVRLLGENRGNVSAVAKALGRRWQVVHRWLRRHGLNADRFRQ